MKDGKKDSGKNYSLPGEVGENPETIEPEIKKKLPEGANFRIRSARKEKSKVWKTGSEQVITTPRWPIGSTGVGAVPMGTRSGEVFEKKKAMMASHLGPGRYDIGKALDKVGFRSQAFSIKEEKSDGTEFTGMAVPEPSGQLSARVEKPFGMTSSGVIIAREHRKVHKQTQDIPILNIPLPRGPSVQLSVVARFPGQDHNPRPPPPDPGARERGNRPAVVRTVEDLMIRHKASVAKRNMRLEEAARRAANTEANRTHN